MRRCAGRGRGRPLRESGTEYKYILRKAGARRYRGRKMMGPRGARRSLLQVRQQDLAAWGARRCTGRKLQTLQGAV